MAEDSIKVDPKHYQVEFENERVRVVRGRYGPHEKSVMHGHPDCVAVYMTNHHVRFTFPDGTAGTFDRNAGEVRFASAGEHLPENLSNSPWSWSSSSLSADWMMSVQLLEWGGS